MDRLIYLVRHGETEWNRAGRVQGHLDSPLTTRGEGQARRVGRTLARLIGAGEGFAMMASPLGRVLHTAAIIRAEMGLAPDDCPTDDRLMEITWGAWDGLTRDEIEVREPGAMARRLQNHWRFVPPGGGESYAMVAERIGGWLGGVASGKRLVVFAHGTAGRVLRGLYAGLGEAETLALDEPQDAFFRLHDGTIERIDAD
jgi:probable phosphoglycerate mutase